MYCEYRYTVLTCGAFLLGAGREEDLVIDDDQEKNRHDDDLGQTPDRNAEVGPRNLPPRQMKREDAAEKLQRSSHSPLLKGRKNKKMVKSSLIQNSWAEIAHLLVPRSIYLVKKLR